MVFPLSPLGIRVEPVVEPVFPDEDQPEHDTENGDGD